MRTNYRIDDFQQSYFVIDSFEALLASAMKDFGGLYEKLRAGADYAPEDVLAGDEVLHKGTQAYFAQKAA